MKKIYDITIPIHNNMPAFPGDEKVFNLQKLMEVEKGDPYSIKKICFLSHTGTHIDAPCHFIPGGKSLDMLDISKFIGITDVINIKNKEKITLNDIKNLTIEANTIILFKTLNSRLLAENRKFTENYVYLSAEAAEFLVKKKIKTVGIDYLSIDPYNNSEPLAHITLLKNDIPIIEGINLLNVPEGRYKLICLPLKISGLDGSPVRAILEEL